MVTSRKRGRAPVALHPANADEPALIAAVREGDIDALGALYERRAPIVYACALRCLASEQDAEDVVQDVFLGLPEALRGYDERGAFESWLKRVAIRCALMRMRQQQRLREDPLDGSVPAFRPEGRPQLDHIAARDAVRRLPDGLRLVFMMKEIEGYAHAEIGEMLGITPGASAVRLTRAWQILLSSLETRP